MLVNTNDWSAIYRSKQALWIHSGNPLDAHALLTSGKHSTGFFNSEKVLEDPTVLDNACFQLMVYLKQSGADMDIINRVVGLAMGAITLASEIARHISCEGLRECTRAYTEKSEQFLIVRRGRKIVVDFSTIEVGDILLEKLQSKMVFKKTSINHGENVLVVEDVLTTGGSVEATVEAVCQNGGNVLPFVLVLVNRSGLKEVNGRKIISLLDHPMPMWGPDECPLCKAGSKALRPKENWDLLNTHH